MIIGVFGLPRQGKTTFLTKCAQLSLRGKSFMGIPAYDTVYTNFECRNCKKLDFDMLGKYNFHDCLILIDEIMLLADCRDFKNFSDELKYFFSHHGHFNITVLWCSQYYSDCDKKIRVLTDHFYLMQSSSWLPVTYIKPIIRSLEPRQGSMTDGYFLGAPYTWRFVYRPHWYKYFDSFTQRDLPPLPPVESWEFPPEEKKQRFPLWKKSKKKKERPPSDFCSDGDTKPNDGKEIVETSTNNTEVSMISLTKCGSPERECGSGLQYTSS